VKKTNNSSTFAKEDPPYARAHRMQVPEDQQMTFECRERAYATFY